MTNNEKINKMSVDEKAKIFASWTTTGACNDFGISTKIKCDGKCELCLKEWLESETKNENCNL